MNTITAREADTMRALLAKYDAEQPAKPEFDLAKFTAAKVANHDKRIARSVAAKSPSAGMTSKQRRALAATLPKGYTTRQWNKACREFIAAGKHI